MLNSFALLDFGAPELLIIFAIILLLFGGKKLPELSKSLGESVREIKNASSSANDLHKEVKSQVGELKSSLTTEPVVENKTEATEV
jgi:sec-independent protein translocase protein TatA